MSRTPCPNPLCRHPFDEHGDAGCVHATCFCTWRVRHVDHDRACEHAWGHWLRTGAHYDSLGGYLGPSYLHFCGSGTPVTGGWIRTCRDCGTTETSPPASGEQEINETQEIRET